MSSGATSPTRLWLAKNRWPVLLAVIGVVIIAFVVATRGEQATWLLWIAVPLLMISLGYLFLINAIPVFLESFETTESESEKKEEPRQ